MFLYFRGSSIKGAWKCVFIPLQSPIFHVVNMVFNVTMEIVYPTSRGAIPSVTATTKVTKQDAHKVFLSLFSSACIIYLFYSWNTPEFSCNWCYKLQHNSITMYPTKIWLNIMEWYPRTDPGFPQHLLSNSFWQYSATGNHWLLTKKVISFMLKEF